MKKTIKIPLNIAPFYTEETVDVFTYAGIEFAITQNCRDTNSLHDITHVYSGLGINGILGQKVTLKNAIKHLEFRMNAIGEEDFFRVINSSQSVEEHIKNNKEKDAKNKEKRALFKELSKLMNMSIPLCKYSLLANDIRVDILRLDNMLVARGYNPNGISIKQYVQQRYGDVAVEILTKLL